MTSRRLASLTLLAASLAGCWETPISDEMTAIQFTPKSRARGQSYNRNRVSDYKR
jgi:hypothetical protein